MSCYRVFRWDKCFSVGRGGVENVTAGTERNVQKTNEIVRKDRCLKIRITMRKQKVN